MIWTEKNWSTEAGLEHILTTALLVHGMIGVSLMSAQMFQTMALNRNLPRRSKRKAPTKVCLVLFLDWLQTHPVL